MLFVLGNEIILQSLYDFHIFFLFIFITVSALGAIKSNLIDPLGHLDNWNDGDPCISNWTGVICHNSTLDDEYLHVLELYDCRFSLC